MCVDVTVGKLHPFSAIIDTPLRRYITLVRTVTPVLIMLQTRLAFALNSALMATCMSVFAVYSMGSGGESPRDV